MDIHVVKFGGSSLGQASSIRQACDIIRNMHQRQVVVVSAMSGVTDMLLQIADDASKGKNARLSERVREFQQRHLEAASELLNEGPLRSDFEQTLNESCAELESMALSLATLQELTPKIQARVVARGERMMALLMTAVLHRHDMPVTYVDAPEVIFVKHGAMGFALDQERCEKRARELLMPQLEERRMPVVPGYIARGPEGELVTLGRGGTDYTATILGASLGAKMVTLYKEVDGFMTADPKFVPQAHLVTHLHYREAAELSYYGANILHPRSISPLMAKKIPLMIKNTFHPDRLGTRIDADTNGDNCPVKALTAIVNQSLIAIEGSGMMGVPGVAQRTFQAMSQAKISVSTISQASSEASICFTLPSSDAAAAILALEAEFQFELSSRLIDRIRSMPSMAIVAVVGMGMRGHKGVAARVFAALARSDVNIVAIAQGSSELNISVVIAESDVKRALNGVHEEYKLDKHHALNDRERGEVDLVFAGFGKIGQALCLQIMSQADYFDRVLKISPKIVGVGDSSGLVVSEDGLDREQMTAFIETKHAGQKFLQSGQLDWSVAFEKQIKPLPLQRGILVDVTAIQTVDLIREALLNRFHVVLANKKPLTASYDSYLELLELAHRNHLMLRYEATVGAGLPILDTLAKFKDTGDELISVAGCLSGTLGYLMTAVEDGMLFSEAVRQALELGYTEPDPREDLSGMDVARKALILARAMGIRAELADVQVTALFSVQASHDDPRVFIENLKRDDAEFQEKIKAAHADGKRLRYVARVSKDKPMTVGLEAVSAESPFFNLRGVANQVSMMTRRYGKNPLTVTGPGAGAEVTAAGVLNDIVAIAMADLAS